MATGVGQGKMQLGSIRWLISILHYRRKSLAEISYASRAIANLVTNFVAMATGIGWGKLRLAAFDGPSP